MPRLNYYHLGNRTTVQKTKNPSDIQQWLADIQVSGGDDCPEFSLTGIQAGSFVQITFGKPGRRLKECATDQRTKLSQHI